MAEQPQRQVAKICSLSMLLSGEFVKDEGWNPNYVQSPIGRISRAHVVGVVVQNLSEQEFLMEDGTGKMNVRAFNMDISIPPVGSVIRCIGRIREYQNNRYLLPEIVKIIDPVWAKIHQQKIGEQPVGEPEQVAKEGIAVPMPPEPVLTVADAVKSEAVSHVPVVNNSNNVDNSKLEQPVHQSSAVPAQVAVNAGVTPSSNVENVQVVNEPKLAPQVEQSSTAHGTSSVEPVQQVSEQPVQQSASIQQPNPMPQPNPIPKPAGQDPQTIIYTMIKNLDEGSGADHEEVISKSNIDNGEQIIEMLMREGEIFLVAPGKLKVLE